MCTLFFDYRLISSNFFPPSARLLCFPFAFSFLFFFFSHPFLKKRERFVCDWDPFGVLPPAFFLHFCQLSLLLSSSSIFSVFSSRFFARCAFPGPFPSGLAHPSSNSVPSHSSLPFFYLQSRSSFFHYFHPFHPPSPSPSIPTFRFMIFLFVPLLLLRLALYL